MRGSLLFVVQSSGMLGGLLPVPICKACVMVEVKTQDIDQSESACNIDLGGGFNYFLFSPLPGEMIQFDEHIFQVG